MSKKLNEVEPGDFIGLAKTLIERDGPQQALTLVMAKNAQALTELMEHLQENYCDEGDEKMEHLAIQVQMTNLTAMTVYAEIRRDTPRHRVLT